MRTQSLETFRSWDKLGKLGERWNQFVANCTDPSVFLTWEWLVSWSEAYTDGSNLLILVARRNDGEPFLIAPMQIVQRRVLPGFTLNVLRFVGDGSFDSDSLNLIADPNHVAEAATAFLDGLEEHRSCWDLVELNALVEESVMIPALQQEFSRRGWICQTNHTPHRRILLPESWEAYWASLSSNMRMTLKKQRRRLESAHKVRIWRCDRPEQLPEALNQMFQLNSQLWQMRGQSGSFSVPQRRDFYYRFAPRMLERGWLDFWLLDADDRTIAAELEFRYADTQVNLMNGFDPECAALSPGNFLRAFVIRNSIERRMRFYDFLGGGDEYKLRWGAREQKYVSLRAAPGRSRGAMYLKLEDSTARGKEWMRAHLPNSAWEFFRRTYRRVRPYRKELSDG